MPPLYCRRNESGGMAAALQMRDVIGKLETSMKRLVPLLILAAACSSAPTPTAAVAPLKIGNYSVDVGPSPVGVIPTTMLHDAQRNKDVEVSIEYPTRGGPFPIIVFSHGYGSSDRAYEPLISYWTSNGYVCIRPAHADAGALRDTAREAMPTQPPSNQRRRNPQPQGIIIPLQPRYPAEEIWDKEREPQWRNRVLDLKLVLDSLEDLGRRFPELQDKMDRTRIGVGGHGYGAFTALTTGDPRVRAVVAMSPPGPSANRGLTAQSFAGLKLPVMFMTGTNDRGGNESEDFNWRRQAFENSPAGDKYFVLIDSARSSSFTGQVSIFDMQPPATPAQAPTGPYGQIQPVPQQQQRGAVVFSNDRRIFAIIKIAS